MPAPSPSSASDRFGVRRLITVEDRSHEFPVSAIGNVWSREYYDGPFHLYEVPGMARGLSQRRHVTGV